MASNGVNMPTILVLSDPGASGEAGGGLVWLFSADTVNVADSSTLCHVDRGSW